MADRKKHHMLTIPVFSPYNSINFSMADFLGPHRCKQTRSEKKHTFIRRKKKLMTRYSNFFPPEKTGSFQKCSVLKCLQLFSDVGKYSLVFPSLFHPPIIEVFPRVLAKFNIFYNELKQQRWQRPQSFYMRKRFNSPRISLGHRYGSSLRTEDVFPVVAPLPQWFFGGREATNMAAVSLF